MQSMGIRQTSAHNAHNSVDAGANTSINASTWSDQRDQSSDTDRNKSIQESSYQRTSNNADATTHEHTAQSSEHTLQLSDPALSHPRELSLADEERRRTRKWNIISYLVALVLMIIVPYGFGRSLAMHHADRIIAVTSRYTAQGMVLLSWSVMLVLLLLIAMAVMESRKLWRLLLLPAVALEQFISGIALLRLNFWTATFVVYGDQALPINALNIGTIAGAVGIAVFAVLYVGMLVLISKHSRLNVLTRSWSALLMFVGIELVALTIALQGGLPLLM